MEESGMGWIKDKMDWDGTGIYPYPINWILDEDGVWSMNDSVALGT